MKNLPKAFVGVHFIRWIATYPLDKVIRSLNNWDQDPILLFDFVCSEINEQLHKICHPGMFGCLPLECRKIMDRIIRRKKD